MSHSSSSFLDTFSDIKNLTISTSVSANALTIAVKTKSGSDPSSGDPVRVGMRSSTLTSGVYNQRSITSALSLVISSGSTLGQTSGFAARLFVYLIDNAGTLELAVSQSAYHENQLISTTAEGGAGGADSGTVIYSTTARSNVPFRMIAIIDNTQTTAGTWTSAGTKLQVGNYSSLTREVVYARYKTAAGQSISAATTTIINFDTQDHDSHSIVTTGASWKARVPISGTYLVSVMLETGAPTWSVGNQIIMDIFKNGSVNSALADFRAQAAAAYRVCLNGSDTIKLLGGEYIDIRHTSDQAHSIVANAAYVHVSITRIGD